MEQGGGVSAPTPAASAPEQPAATDSGAAPESTQADKSAQPDDPEYELGGEKVKLSEYKRLRELEAKRKEYDRAASLRFEESAKLKKEAAAEREQAQALVAGLSKDAKAALRKAGIDPIKFAEQTLSEALAEQDMSPAEKELREYKAREAERQAEEEKRKADEAAQQDSAIVNQVTNDLSQQFLSALKPLNLPEDDLPEAVGRMAARFEALMESGEPFDLADLAADVADRLIAAPEHRFAALSDEQLLERHPALAERFRKALLAKAQKQPQPKQSSAPAERQRTPVKRGLTMAELQERIDKRLGA